VSYFETVNVRLVFLIAAERIADSICRETKNVTSSNRAGRAAQSSTVRTPHEFPCARAASDCSIAEVEKHENHRGHERESFPDVIQRIMAHFVAEHRQDAASCFLERLVSQITTRLVAPIPVTYAFV